MAGAAGAAGRVPAQAGRAGQRIAGPPIAGQATPRSRRRPGLSPFPPQLSVDLDLDIAETAFRKGTIRDLALALEIRNGAITVPRFKATLPGEMPVQADAAVDAAGKGSGSFTLAGRKLRDTLAWLDVDASGVPKASSRAFR